MRQISALEVGYQYAQINARIHDMPIGDAFKGPAYGEYDKSGGLGMILGVVASVLTMGAALPMLASTMLATQIAGGVMMAGGVLTGVGAITGNQKLMKIGGVLSLAGGIGNLALNATGTAGALGSGSEALSKFATSVGDTFGMEFAATAASDASAASAVTDTAASSASGVGDLSQVQLAEASGLPQLSDAGGISMMNQAGAAPEAFSLAGTAPEQINLANSAGTAGTAAAAAAKPGILQSSLDFVKNNPELAKVGGSMITEFAKAGFAPDQEAALAADMRYKDAAASKIGQETVLLAWQDANRKKQVALISANDPAKDAKVAAATAAGHAVSIIPVVGAPKPVAGAAPTTNAQSIATTNPAPVFNATVPAVK